jgi:hypothetical protein
MTRRAVKFMPIGRYFVFVGSVLLALLFLADRNFPGQITPSARADVDRSVIRIQTRHKWPEAVVYDTSLPTIVPTAVAVAAFPERPPLDAFAQVPPAPPPAHLQVAETLPRPEKAKRTAKQRPPARRVANYQPVEPRGFFQVGW